MSRARTTAVRAAARTIGALVAAAILASACGLDIPPEAARSQPAVSTPATRTPSDDSGSPARSTSGPQGWLYVGAFDGELAVIDLSGGPSGVLWNKDAKASVVDIGPTSSGAGLHVLLGDRTQVPIATTLHELHASKFRPVETEIDGELLCLDPHPDAVDSRGVITSSAPSTDGGVVFTPQIIGTDTAMPGPASETLVSQVCPRWTGDRGTVATAVSDGVFTRTVIEGQFGHHELDFPGCSTSPLSVSPDDSTLLVTVTCFAHQWRDTGLYTVDLAALETGTSLDDMAKIDDGVVSRATWRGDGVWVAIVRTAPVQSQTPLTDYRALFYEIRVVNVRTGEAHSVRMVDDLEPFSVIWLDEAAHRS